MTIKVVTVVLTERVMVSQIEVSTISAKLPVLIILRFSRIRSKTTMVALMEYPKIVSAAAMKLMLKGMRKIT